MIFIFSNETLLSTLLYMVRHSRMQKKKKLFVDIISISPYNFLINVNINFCYLSIFSLFTIILLE